MAVTDLKKRKAKVMFLSKLNAMLLAVIVTLSLGVVYSTHQSRLLVSQQNDLFNQLEEQSIKHSQLMLEEGTFARAALVERKARKELQLQKITLER